MYLHSVAAYVDKIVDEIDASSIETLQKIPLEELGRFHHSWGMAIRNEFGLWQEDHPLTANWFAHPEKHDLRDGVDYSEDHPDAVSMRIMEGVWQKLNS